ncbi:GFA family protein [Mesobacterium pallidum]|uniref:GFA family protein n=1 Tax=Mesobacterium pallidum TaxID=2872037 RepID=UPI001EE277F7|nr:GFA family protein [Mesobacterium pallidum]
MSEEIHEGGCQCGQVRYRTTGQPEKAAVCHCRYCQARTGSAFGVSAYFNEGNVEILSGQMKDYSFVTESGRDFTTHFCPDCGTNVMWTLEVFPGLRGIAGGSFDPPTFWFDVKREVFARGKAPFVELCLEDSFETSSSYAPVSVNGD